jgi:hypothetical protein
MTLTDSIWDLLRDLRGLAKRYPNQVPMIRLRYSPATCESMWMRSADERRSWTVHTGTQRKYEDFSS